MGIYHLVELGVGSVLIRCDVIYQGAGGKVGNTLPGECSKPVWLCLKIRWSMAILKTLQGVPLFVFFHWKPRWMLGGSPLIWDRYTHCHWHGDWFLSRLATEWSTIRRCLKYDDFQKQAQKNRPRKWDDLAIWRSMVSSHWKADFDGGHTKSSPN